MHPISLPKLRGDQMGRKPKQHYPSFFKVLMDDFASKLLIPRAFVKRNLEGKVPAKALIKDRNDSHWWTVEVEKTGEKNHYSFMRNGWRKFVKDCELKKMDFLVFELISNSVFEIVRYAPSGCEQDLISNPIELPVQDSVSEEIRVNPAAKAREPRSRKSREALPHPSFRRRSSGTAAETTGSGEQTEHPNFEVVFRKHHRSCLTLPKDFVRATGIARKRRVELRNEEGKVWRVEICLRTYPTSHGRIDLRYGWSDFWKQNKIVDGDSCLFKFIKSARNVIDVVVQKTNEGR